MLEKLQNIEEIKQAKVNLKYLLDNRDKIPPASKLINIPNPYPGYMISYATIIGIISDYSISDWENLTARVAADIAVTIPSIVFGVASAINSIVAYMKMEEILHTLKKRMLETGVEDTEKYIRMLGPVTRRSVGTCTKAGMIGAINNFFIDDREKAHQILTKLFPRKSIF